MKRVTGIGGIVYDARGLVALRDLDWCRRRLRADVQDRDGGVFGGVMDPAANDVEPWQRPQGQRRPSR